VVPITKESVNSIVQSIDCTCLWVGMYLSNGDVATMAYGWMKKIIVHLDHWWTLTTSTWMYMRKVTMNWMGVWKKWLFNTKMMSYPKRKHGRRELLSNFLAFEVFWYCIFILCLQCVLQHEWRKCAWKIVENSKGIRSIESCKAIKNEKTWKKKHGNGFFKTTRIARGIGEIGRRTSV